MPSTRPRADVQELLSALSVAKFPPIETQSPEQARDSMVAGLLETDLPIGEISVVRDFTIPSPNGIIRALLLDARPERDESPIVLWFHGGGFVTGGIDTHRSFAAEVARQLDLPVVLVDYRLAPEAPFPAAVEDAEAAARWLANSPASLGLSITSLVLGGDSVGGALTSVTSMALRDSPAPVPVLAQFLIYPALDYTRTYASEEEFGEGYLMTKSGNRWYLQQYRPKVDEIRASPLLGTFDGLPPAVILTSGMDLFRDQGRAYSCGLTSAGVPTTYLEAKGMIHAFVLMRKALPSVQADLGQAFAFLRTLVS